MCSLVMFLFWLISRVELQQTRNLLDDIKAEQTEIKAALEDQKKSQEQMMEMIKNLITAQNSKEK